MDKQAFWETLVADYEKRTPKSRRHFERAIQNQIRGGSHNLRLFEPYPFYDVRCKGAYVWDLDGNEYLDFWQGHYTNILGHNPPEVINQLIDLFGGGQGLQTGFPGARQAELAEEVCRLTGFDRVRFTTSGALATLYSVMLSRGATGRSLALKVAGGWHGSQPYLLKGITAYDRGLTSRESAGLHPSCVEEIITTRFNDVESLEADFPANAGRRSPASSSSLSLGRAVFSSLTRNIYVVRGS